MLLQINQALLELEDQLVMLHQSMVCEVRCQHMGMSIASFGILLLEMFTGERPTDHMFSDSLNLHNFVKMALPERVAYIRDNDSLLSSRRHHQYCR
ncbi:putative non-specific serine/threonine protein kinase [Rosa chinensis]|uniref:Putative non-specific serine/threonine protein kinase n=1 Tax=Rosa chinensis TaxID=74649 RepID=A0A2P6SHN1_ROSCH|nr:putative non-specific serine/threonine protein kinase [Rosa chinensis]